MRKNPVITTTRLTRRFGQVTAVSDLNLEVYAGEIFGFLGHNGAGKTTTVRLLNGILTPSDGTARVLGLSPIDDGPTLRRRTGVLTETPSLEERLTARDNLAIYADLHAVPQAEVGKRVDELLETFGLSERADEKVGAYSRGMKQRLALARALLHSPEMLFLDEPTSGLDPVTTRRVQEMITRMSRGEGRTIFLTTHNLAEAQRLCDRVAVLEFGRIIALGTPIELARQMTPAQRVEIEVGAAQIERTRELLNKSAGVNDVKVENGTFVVTGVDRESIPDLAAGLVSAGVRIYRLAPGEPSLEEVYFALHRQEESQP